MDQCSNYRKRRLIDESILNGKTTPPIMYSKSHTSQQSSPIMNFNARTQTDIELCGCQINNERLVDLSNRIEKIEDNCKEILKILKDRQNDLEIQPINDNNSTRIVEYKIIGNDQDIRIEPLKDEGRGEELKRNVIKQPIFNFSSIPVEKESNVNISKIKDDQYNLFNNEVQIESKTSDFHDNFVKLGPNGTAFPIGCIVSLETSSPSAATRKLLTTIFDRKTLATHTLTGKPSPAFQGRERPPKNQLDPKVVADIISVITNKFNIPERDVRSAITTKCADENKMFKQREQKLRNLNELNNKENMVYLRKDV